MGVSTLDLNLSLGTLQWLQITVSGFSEKVWFSTFHPYFQWNFADKLITVFYKWGQGRRGVSRFAGSLFTSQPSYAHACPSNMGPLGVSKYPDCQKKRFHSWLSSWMHWRLGRHGNIRNWCCRYKIWGQRWPPGPLRLMWPEITSKPKIASGTPPTSRTDAPVLAPRQKNPIVYYYL